MTECFCCGRDTRMPGYIFRVVNPSFQTLFVSPCIRECIGYMEKGGFATVQCYKIEVMPYEG
jgi:hypothetical protein